MNPRHLATLSFVALGALSVLTALAMLETVFVMAFWPAQEGFNLLVAIVVALIPVAVLLGFACYLVANRERSAQVLFPEVSDRPSTITAEDVHVVGLSVVGVLILCLAIPEISKALGNLVEHLTLTEPPSIVTGTSSYIRPPLHIPTYLVEVAGILLQVAIGAVLALRTRAVINLLARLGKPKQVPAPTASCPDCGHLYRIEDYQPDAAPILCSKCHRELPRDSG